MASLSKMQDVKNPQTKDSSFSAQLWITDTASWEEADGVPCNINRQKKIQNEFKLNIDVMYYSLIQTKFSYFLK